MSFYVGFFWAAIISWKHGPLWLTISHAGILITMYWIHVVVNYYFLCVFFVSFPCNICVMTMSYVCLYIMLK